MFFFFFFQAEDGIRDYKVTGVQTCALPICLTTTPCRSVVADCSVYSHGNLIQPWHPYTRASQTPLTPGTPTELEVEIFPTTAVIQPGHSLRLTIATGDFPHETSTLSTTLGSAGLDTLYLGADHPSAIRVGVVSPAPG